jgi:hypothetical protein
MSREHLDTLQDLRNDTGPDGPYAAALDWAIAAGEWDRDVRALLAELLADRTVRLHFSDEAIAKIERLANTTTAPAQAGDGEAETQGGDWYTRTDTGSVCIDWDADPKRQLSLICKRDGTVGFAAYIDGERVRGPDAMVPEFFDVLRRLATPPPSAAPAVVGLDVTTVKEVIAKYVGRTSRIYLYIANDLAQAHREALAATPAAPEASTSQEAGFDALALIDSARREFRDSDAARDVLDWLEEAYAKAVTAPPAPGAE